MKKFVLLVGATNSQKEIIDLRRYQVQLERVGAPVVNILDFAYEGEDAPGYSKVERIKKMISNQASSIVVMNPQSDLLQILLDHASDHNVPFFNYLDIDLNNTPKNMWKKPFWDRVDDFLRPWFTNPMKAQQLNH